MRNSLIPSKAPSIPPPAVSGFVSILTLYFSKLDSLFRSILGPIGGQYIDCPYGLFFNTVDQTFAAANTAYPVAYNATYLTNSVDLSNTSRINTRVAGVYNFQYSGQFTSTNASTKNIFVWLRRNGTDIGFSTRDYTLSGSGASIAVTWDFDIDMDVNEYMEVVVAVTDTNVLLNASASAAPHPGIASSVISVNFIAPIPDPRPTPPPP
jgi:hypothetical protein